MYRSKKYITGFTPAPAVPRDLSDCFTNSFHEFLPFAHRLYYLSNFKDFSPSLPA